MWNSRAFKLPKLLYATWTAFQLWEEEEQKVPPGLGWDGFRRCWALLAGSLGPALLARPTRPRSGPRSGRRPDSPPGTAAATGARQRTRVGGEEEGDLC